MILTIGEQQLYLTMLERLGFMRYINLLFQQIFNRERAEIMGNLNLVTGYQGAAHVTSAFMDMEG